MSETSQVDAPAAGPPLVLNGLSDVTSSLGHELGKSSWRLVEQQNISAFAALTDDEQWIHVDPERAATGPFGMTVQHGFLTLSMATTLLSEVCVVNGFSMVLNYGLNKVRFPAPLKVGSRYRISVLLADVKPLDSPAGYGAEMVYRLTYEVEGEAKPCCVADFVIRYYP